MSGAGENYRNMEYNDSSPAISPAASLVSCRTESPEFPAEFPPNPLPIQPHQNSRDAISKLPKPKQLWKSAFTLFTFKGRQKPDRSNFMDGGAMDDDSVDKDFMGGDVRIAG